MCPCVRMCSLFFNANVKENTNYMRNEKWYSRSTIAITGNNNDTMSMTMTTDKITHALTHTLTSILITQKCNKSSLRMERETNKDIYISNSTCCVFVFAGPSRFLFITLYLCVFTLTWTLLLFLAFVVVAAVYLIIANENSAGLSIATHILTHSSTQTHAH